MTSKLPQAPTCDTMDHASVQIAFSSVTAEKRESTGGRASAVEEAGPRIWKVMAIRKRLRMGQYRVTTEELADALWARAATASK